jgi:hypothetical protein
MKKIIILILVLVAVSLNDFAQTLYVPSGTSGIGSSTTANVGIGISNPAATLDVNGTLRTNLAYIRNPFSGTGYAGFMYKNFSGNDYALLQGSDGTTYLNAATSKNIYFRTGNVNERMIILSNGNVGIGTVSPDYKLTVKGTIKSGEVLVVDPSTIPADYVFEKDYRLRSLNELETYINTNKHLPEVPSGQELTQNGWNMVKMQNSLLQKVEELSLYLIEQDKLIKAQSEQIQVQAEQLKALLEAQKNN